MSLGRRSIRVFRGLSEQVDSFFHSWYGRGHNASNLVLGNVHVRDNVQLKLGALQVASDGASAVSSPYPEKSSRASDPPRPMQSINWFTVIAPMSNNTIPRPLQASPAHVDEQLPSPLFPLRSPPEPLRYPPLPCPPRHHHFTASYTVTTHLIPAAFPRFSPFVPLPPFPIHETKEERAAHIQRLTGELLSLEAQHVPDQSGTQQTVLWSVLNRYVRKSIGGGNGLTLLLLHANGLHKEVSVKSRAFLPTY